jgi:hypothetical protein
MVRRDFDSVPSLDRGLVAWALSGDDAGLAGRTDFALDHRAVWDVALTLGPVHATGEEDVSDIVAGVNSSRLVAGLHGHGVFLSVGKLLFVLLDYSILPRVYVFLQLRRIILSL